MPILNNYQYYCITEKCIVKDCELLSSNPPLRCKNGNSHIIDIGSIKRISITQMILPDIRISKTKDNLNANRDPIFDDDVRDGYSVGSSWFNQKSHKLFSCISNDKNNAIWLITQGSKDIQSLVSPINLNINQVQFTDIKDIILTTKNDGSAYYTITFLCDIELISGNDRSITFVINVNGTDVMTSQKTYSLDNKGSNKNGNVVIMFNTNVSNNNDVKIRAKVSGGIIQLKNINFHIVGF